MRDWERLWEIVGNRGRGKGRGRGRDGEGERKGKGIDTINQLSPLAVNPTNINSSQVARNLGRTISNNLKRFHLNELTNKWGLENPLLVSECLYVT